MNDSSGAPTEREIFHKVWKLVSEHFYDVERLEAIDWTSLEHHFDERIALGASGLACAEEALARLGDKYTTMLSAEKVAAKLAARCDDSLDAYCRVYPTHGVNIGYIGISSFSHSEICAQVKERLELVAHCEGFVVDVRGNSGGLLDATGDVLELFLDDAPLAIIEQRIPSGMQTRRLSLTREHFVADIERTALPAEHKLMPRQAPLVAGKPMVVLIDEDTGSSAELFTAALVASGFDKGSVLVMGRKSGGKGIGQSDFDVLGVATLKMSFCRFSAPWGQWFGDHGQTVSNGLAPDVFIAAKPDDSVAQQAVDGVLSGARWLSTFVHRNARIAA